MGRFQLHTQPFIAIENDRNRPQYTDSVIVYYNENTPLSLGDIFVRFGFPEYVLLNRDANGELEWLDVSLVPQLVKGEG